jgi:predicted AAA+ superfamily ATPase
MGQLFESAVIHDLRVYAEAIGAEVFHYRDSAGRELDAVIVLEDGSWVGVEVKLGFGAADDAAAGLLRVAAGIDTARTGPQRALVVVTGNGFAHRRADGVYVVPFPTLAPR